MNLDRISIGRDAPFEVNALIEVPLGGEPIKYELDKSAGILVVDRFLHTAMFYPGQLRLHPPHAWPRTATPCDMHGGEQSTPVTCRAPLDRAAAPSGCC